MRLPNFLKCSIIAAFCSSASPALPTWRGVGDILIGVPENVARQKFGAKDEEPIDEEYYNSCHYLIAHVGDQTIFPMVTNGHINRIDFLDASSLGPKGIRIGSPEQLVKYVFGKNIHRQPAAYNEEPDHELTAWNRQTGTGYVFEIENGRVARFRLGRKTELGWIEGCL